MGPMPNTWSATTIQVLTQSGLRAFFRVITRKREGGFCRNVAFASVLVSVSH
jgi:hypothetical protein